MANTVTQYSDLLEAVRAYYGSSDEWAEIAKYGLKADNCYDILKQVPGVNITRNKNGDVIGYSVNAQTVMPTSDIPSAINSNAQTGQYSSSGSLGFKPVGNASVDQSTGNVTMSSNVIKKTSGTAEAAKAIVGTATAAYMGVAIGGSLGKTINSALYNNNPNFWNDLLDKQTLSPMAQAVLKGITTAEDFVYEKTGFKVNYDQLNALVGWGSDNKSQLYVEQDAYALFAAVMAQNGFFAQSEPQAQGPESDFKGKEYFNFPLTLIAPDTLTISFASGKVRRTVKTGNFEYGCICAVGNVERPTIRFRLYSRSPFTLRHINYNANGEVVSDNTTIYSSISDRTYVNNTPYYMWSSDESTDIATFISLNPSLPINFTSANVSSRQIATAIFDGNIAEGGGVDGVGSQENANLPNTSNWDNSDPIGSVLPSLQAQYPDLWDNAINISVPQPDGTIQNRTYIPVPTPDGETPNAQGLPNPTISGQNSNQSTPYIDPATITDPILNYFKQLLSNPNATPAPQPQPDPNAETTDTTTNPNPNPPDTGSGSSPTIILPTGNASSLWKVYHPSQAQVDAFGAWLWSSNFVEQIKKMFNDPMQSIIGLHKIFAAPIDAGTATIKVGYLDSEVASAYVDNQYVTVDCGSVTLREYFGNVFDYEPHTKVAIFLPFIGIQKLDVAEVMRSTISVIYHVDVFSGACLAEVSVTRDGGGGCLYTFSGDASARYPISSGSYMGIVSGVLSIAGGIAGTIATGGAALPAVVGAGVAATHMHTDVKHSGQISGNAGAMGGKVPYLIVVRPQTEVAQRSEKYYGYGANSYCKVENLSGFARLYNAVVRPNDSITDEERKEIQTILESGFYA